MSQKKEKAKRKAEAEKAAPEEPKAPVTVADLAQANERLHACQEAHRNVLARTQEAREQSAARLQAVHNAWVTLTARAKEQNAK